MYRIGGQTTFGNEGRKIFCVVDQGIRRVGGVMIGKVAGQKGELSLQSYTN